MKNKRWTIIISLTKHLIQFINFIVIKEKHYEKYNR
jgi:hypothetical protein